MARLLSWFGVSALLALPRVAVAQIVVPPEYEASVFASGIAGPEGLAIDAAGDLYVAATGADNVTRVTPDGSVSVFATSCTNPLAFAPGYPTKMTFGLDGLLYVGAVGWYYNPCNTRGDVYDKLLRISPIGEVGVAASGTGCCSDPFDDISGIATAADGRIFFTDTWSSGSIFAYSPANGSLVRWAAYPPPYRPFTGGSPTAAAFDGAGNLLVSFWGSRGPGDVLRFAPDGSVGTAIADFSAYALRFDARGNLWASDYRNVYEVAPDGTRRLFASGFQSAADLIFDRDGNMYVSEYSTNRVVKISLAVIQVGVDVKPGSFPNSVNLGSAGTVPVAILSSAAFDARTVDPATVTVAGAPVATKRNGALMYSFEDVNGDGLLDLVVHVRTQALGLAAGDVTAALAGATQGGRRIAGADSVRIVP